MTLVDGAKGHWNLNPDCSSLSLNYWTFSSFLSLCCFHIFIKSVQGCIFFQFRYDLHDCTCSCWRRGFEWFERWAQARVHFVVYVAYVSHLLETMFTTHSTTNQPPGGSKTKSWGWGWKWRMSPWLSMWKDFMETGGSWWKSWSITYLFTVFVAAVDWMQRHIFFIPHPNMFMTSMTHPC